jgi:hypothetical protein
VSHAYIILVVSAFGMAAYVTCAIKAHRILKADDLLTFSLWCGAAVAGFFAFISAFKLSKQADQETNAIYLGIFGLCLVWLAVQKTLEMVRELFPPPPPPTPPHPTQSNEPKQS